MVHLFFGYHVTDYVNSPVVYIYFGVFFLQSLLLAIIVAIYLDRAGKAVTSERKKEWKTLVTAFKLLDQDGKGYIDTETWGHLMYTLQPYATIDEVRFKFDLLDREKKGLVANGSALVHACRAVTVAWFSHRTLLRLGTSTVSTFWTCGKSRSFNFMSYTTTNAR